MKSPHSSASLVFVVLFIIESQGQKTIIEYQIKDLDIVLKEFHHCHIFLRILQSEVYERYKFQVDLDPIEVPVAIYYGSLSTLSQEMIWDDQYVSFTLKSIGTRFSDTSKCRALIFIPRDLRVTDCCLTKYLNQELRFCPPHIIDSEDSFTEDCWERSSYVILLSFSSQRNNQGSREFLPKVRLTNPFDRSLTMRKYIILHVYPTNCSKNLTLGFEINGAHLGWNSNYTKISSNRSRGRENNSTFIFSLNEIEIGMEDLLVRSNNGKVYNKPKRNEQYVVRRCHTLKEITLPFRKPKMKFPINDVIMFLLLEDIENRDFYGRSNDTCPYMDMKYVLYARYRYIGKFAPNQIMYGSYSLNLATCRNTTMENMNFYKYTSPFEHIVWFCMVLTIMAISTVLYVTYILKIPKDKGGRKWDFIYNVVAITAGTLLETAPDLAKEIKNTPCLKRVFRILIGYWGLAAVFITTEYRNELVVDLLAPVPVGNSLKKFSEAKLFRFYVSAPTVDLLQFGKPHISCFNQFSKVCNLTIRTLNSSGDISPECYNLLKSKYPLIQKLRLAKSEINKQFCIFDAEDDSLKSQFNSFLIKYYEEHIPPTIYDEINTCSRKGIIAENALLDKFIEYSKLRNKKIVFNKGEESVFRGIDTYRFFGWNALYFYSRMQLLMQSGIFYIWDKYWKIHYPKPLDDALNKLRKQHGNGNEAVPISMRSTIITAVYIYLVGLSIATLAIFLECRLEIYFTSKTVLLLCLFQIVYYISRFFYHLKKKTIVVYYRMVVLCRNLCNS